MVDYNKSTGSSGTMQIKDLGTTIEFWINAGNSITFHHQLPWGYTVNGVTNNNREYDYKAGSGWEKLGSWSVTTDQVVTFRLGDTGTSGFGGPTVHSVSINRASVPSAPGVATFSNLTGSSVTVTFSAASGNGATVDAYQIGYNRSATISGATIISSDRSTNVTGLLSGTTYYFWTRAHNSKGWGPWSSPRSVTTLSTPPAPTIVTLSEITQSTMRASFGGNGSGGSPVLEWQLVYNTVNSTVGASTMTYVSPSVVVTNLKPGTTYYFWSRARNSIGWSAYSAVSSAKTLAGVRLKVNGVWVTAVPYVNIAGVWKPARPWGRVGGFWKESL